MSHILPEKYNFMGLGNESTLQLWNLRTTLTCTLLLINRSLVVTQRSQGSCLPWTWRHSSLTFFLVKSTLWFLSIFIVCSLFMKIMGILRNISNTPSPYPGQKNKQTSKKPKFLNKKFPCCLDASSNMWIVSELIQFTFRMDTKQTRQSQ